MTFKIEGQCANCENMAVEEVLEETLCDYVNVCEECFRKVFLNVANQGVMTFYEWAYDTYGDTKAVGLCKEIYGDKAIEEIGLDEDMKQAYLSDEMVTIFTYGILKYRKNIEREGGINIVENATVRGHRMHLYNNSFPITSITNNDNDIIFGTLFEVPKYVLLSQYDYIEGYNPKAHPSTNMYNRIEVEVTTPNGEKKMAQMYYCNQRQFAKDLNKNTLIKTGNYDDRRLVKSYNWKKR